MITSLVTGGAGFIGAHVTNHLLHLKHKVIVLDDLSGGFEDNVNPNAIFIKGSINDIELITCLFDEYKFDYIYHLAAYAAEGLSHFIRHFNYTNNLLGSVNLINASVKHKVKCFVFTSSIAVYGTQNPPMIETAAPAPEDPYGVAKYAVEMDLQAAHEIFGLNYIIFRPHNVYGSLQNIGDRYRNVIGIFMNQLLQGHALTVFGDGTQRRAFSAIADVAPHIANSVNVPKAYNELINVGGDIDYSVNELAETVMKVMGLRSNIRHLEARNEVVNAYADHQKAHDLFNINPKDLTNLEDGLREMAEWVRKAGSRKAAKFENIEITEKLPSVWLED